MQLRTITACRWCWHFGLDYLVKDYPINAGAVNYGVLLPAAMLRYQLPP